MSFTVYVNDKTVDLGGSFEVIRQFASIGKIDPTGQFPALMGLINASGEDLDPAYVERVTQEAGRFQAEFRDDIDHDLRDFLGRLAHLPVNGQAALKTTAYQPREHPRWPSGGPHGGEFRPKPGAEISREQFMRTLETLPVGTRFTLTPEGPQSGYWSLRGTWERADYGGRPYWYNAERGLTRTSGDFFAFAAPHVLAALKLERKPKELSPHRLRRISEFLASPEHLVERGRLASAHTVQPGPLLQHNIDQAVASIEQVHKVRPLGGLPLPPKVAVIAAESDGGEEASYAFSRNDSAMYAPEHIRIQPAPMYPEAALVHEVGHYIDQQILGARVGFGSAQALVQSRDDHPLAPVMAAIKNSDGMRTLATLYASEEMVAVRLQGVPEYVSLQDPRIHNYGGYLMQPLELFARAYTQWIATRSGDPPMVEFINGRKMSAGQIHPQQWEDYDFEAIADAFDAAFAKLGWMET